MQPPDISITLSLFLAVLTLVINVTSWAWTYYKEIAGLKERTSIIETKMELFWDVVESEIPRLLKSNPITQIPTRKDVLLDKMSQGQLSGDEVTELETTISEDMKRGDYNRTITVVQLLILTRLRHM